MVPSDLTDEQLAAQTQRGDAESFGSLVNRYESKLLRYAKKFLLGNEDGRDLVQEVFLKAYSNINNFDVKRRFSPWLYRIAHNEFINAIKKRSRFPVFSFDFLDTILPQPVAGERAEDDMEKRENRELIDGVLDGLDVKYREPLILYYIEDLDYHGIAEVLQIPVSTVGVRLSRGKNILKKKLKPHV